MACQYSGGCLNPGIKSCKYCGKLFCGKHSMEKYYPRDGIVVICDDCKTVIIKDYEKRAKPYGKASGFGCYTTLIGIAIAILGNLFLKSIPISIIGPLNVLCFILIGFGVLLFLISAFVGPSRPSF